MPVSTPCLGICSVDEDSQLCVGCFRHMQEISRWRNMEEAERLAIMEHELPERRIHFAYLSKRYGE